VSVADANLDTVALAWLRGNTAEDAVVMSMPDDGRAIAALARRRPVVDGDFLRVRDGEQRYADVRTVFTSPYLTSVVEAMHRYGARYVYVSPVAQRDFDIGGLPAASGEGCLREVFRGDAVIYRSECEVSG
jgi:uncharacterized membrane protein